MIDVAVQSLLIAHAGSGVGVVNCTDVVTTGLPKVIWNHVRGPRTYNDSGPDGIVSAQYQLDIFAAELSQAATIAETLRLALDGFKGTQDGVRILRVHFPERPIVKAEPVQTGSHAAVSRATVPIVFTFREQVTP